MQVIKIVFTDITESKSNLMNADSVKKVEDVNDQVTEAIKSLFAVAENYPDLKASQNFQDLQMQLSETEDKIAYSRQFYNDIVLMYNNKSQMFPSNLPASLSILMKLISWKLMNLIKQLHLLNFSVFDKEVFSCG